MTEIKSTDPREDGTDEVCVLDPGGEDRASVPVTDADHSPGADPDGLDRVFAPVADALLAAAEIRPGESVVDLGCGCGATTLRAAHAVAPGGSVYGIDVTEAMLVVARRRLASSGLNNVSLVHGDAQTDALPGSFDAAISRFGTMFFDDPVAAFTNIGQSLRAGGRVCLATWQPLEVNEWLAVPGAALLRWITLPDFSAGGPGMFAQSDPDTVTATLHEAGYTEVELQPVSVTLPLGADPNQATTQLADTGVGRAVLDAVPESQRPAATAAVRAALADHAAPDGVVRLGAAVWIITALRPPILK
jgi:SAM-dependent methyltransferase